LNKFENTWSLMRASWQVLKKDKELLIFPVISAVCCILVLASFASTFSTGGVLHLPDKGAPFSDQFDYYFIRFLIYFCIYLTIIFFNSAIVACASIRMKGGDPTVMDGLRAVMSCILFIIGWALVSATIGMLISIIENRAKKAGRLTAKIFGMAWSLISFTVIPYLVIENKNPISALKESTNLLKKTWGHQLIGNFSFGLVFFIWAIPAIVIYVIIAIFGEVSSMIPLIGIILVYFVGLAIIQSALKAIFQTAVFLYARDGFAPSGFNRDILMDSFLTRRSMI